MAELKTKPGNESARAFIEAIPDEGQRNDCFAILELMQSATKSEPVMWGGNIVGFGTYQYVYASGREGDWFLTGFSPRKQNITLYFMTGFEQHSDLMARLGKHKTGKSCLYIKRLADVDQNVLKQLILQSITQLQAGKT